MNKTVTYRAPAKINLWLDIRSKRPDGYHNIESVMQTVTLFDTLTVVRGEREGQHITITCDDPHLPCDERNLCYRAAKRFFDEAEIAVYDVSIDIGKKIPIAAGLGGGSTDAAATLRALGELYPTSFGMDELCALGAKIGADVPFCIRQGISVTRGIGDVFADCPRLPACHILLACAGEGVSTPWAYGRLDEMYDFEARGADADGFVSLLAGGDIHAIAAGMSNIFESAVLFERESAAKLKALMLKGGALAALMSGSGPSVFGIFPDEKAASDAQRQLAEAGITAHICTPYYPEGIK